MKKLFIMTALVLAMLLALSACGGGGSLSVVGDGSAVTVEAQNAEDMGGESSITIGEGEMLVIAPELTSGALHVTVRLEGGDETAPPAIEWDFSGTEPTEYGMLNPGDYTVAVETQGKTEGTMKLYTAPLEGASDGNEAVFTSPDGWSVRYDPALIEVHEGGGEVDFVYIGESAGTNMMSVRFVEGQTPEEVLGELTGAWGTDDRISAYEGFLPGTTDTTGFWRVLDPEEGSGLSETAIAGEYNGGTLLFEFVNHLSGDDETDMAVSGALSSIIDSITYEK